MPFFVLHRNYTLSTTHGVITFVKGERTWVAPGMVPHVVAIGAECVDEDAPDVLAPEAQPVKAPQGDERMQQLFVAFDLIREKNDAKEFTGQGVPTVKAVEKIVSFAVERGEIAVAHGKYLALKAEQQ